MAKRLNLTRRHKEILTSFHYGMSKTTKPFVRGTSLISTSKDQHLLDYLVTNDLLIASIEDGVATYTYGDVDSTTLSNRLN